MDNSRPGTVVSEKEALADARKNTAQLINVLAIGMTIGYLNVNPNKAFSHGHHFFL